MRSKVDSGDEIQVCSIMTQLERAQYRNQTAGESSRH